GAALAAWLRRPCCIRLPAGRRQRGRLAVRRDGALADQHRGTPASTGGTARAGPGPLRVASPRFPPAGLLPTLPAPRPRRRRPCTAVDSLARGDVPDQGELSRRCDALHNGQPRRAAGGGTLARAAAVAAGLALGGGGRQHGYAGHRAHPRLLPRGERGDPTPVSV